MHVTYSPPLMEQIKGNHAAAEKLRTTPVVIKVLASDTFVMKIDPKTRTETTERQQFSHVGDKLTPLSRWDWVEHPNTLKVGWCKLS